MCFQRQQGFRLTYRCAKLDIAHNPIVPVNFNVPYVFMYACMYVPQKFLAHKLYIVKKYNNIVGIYY